MKWDIEFQETEIITKLEDLKNHMLAMWIPFKNNHFNYAIKKLNELANLSLSHKEYFSLINEYLDNLTPIFSIYEIFNRSLSESVYPESIPQTKRLGAYFARFLSSKYNIFGVNLMHLFNKLSYNNWSYLIYRKKLSMHKLFNLILNLPIWKYVPKRIKRRILDSNLEYIR
ncbi:MAG: hypothetical protein ACFFKA_16695 [Candidatus Thorarchaeota archaeon]